MRNTFPLLAAVAALGALVSGCTNMETKLGRGLNNTLEPIRLGEMQRTMEQTALFDGSSAASTTGFIRGLTRTVAKTAVGAYEVVTFPLPNPHLHGDGCNYDAVFTDYMSPHAVYPDSYKPGMKEDSMYATDSNLGFAGGDVAPMVPGSRFRIFDSN
jgi:putative exosortase-associated protein (TIGR04073 family)